MFFDRGESMNFKVMAKNAVEYAKCDGIVLDWTRGSVLCVEKILIGYRDKYSGQKDAKWKLSSFSACYATYVGELMLKKGLYFFALRAVLWYDRENCRMGRNVPCIMGRPGWR